MGRSTRRSESPISMIHFRRFLNQLFIPGCALLAVLIVSYCAPKFLTLTKRQSKNNRNLDNDNPKILARERLRKQLEASEREPYTDHGPFITDEITNFIINAEPCVGSNLPPGSNSVTDRRGQQMYSPLTNLAQRSPGEWSGIGRVGGTHHYDALFIVCSNVRNATNRHFFRQIYGNHSRTMPYRIKLVFLVGKSFNLTISKGVQEEAKTYGDIVMGNFTDHYDNLTYKTAMGYRWIHTHCRNVDLMLKLDDDVFVDVFKFMAVFRPRIGKATRTINCFLNKNPRVHRTGKYKIFDKEYKGEKYPQFCSGFFIVPTPDIVDSLYEISKNTRFFRLEDVFTYGLVRTAMVDVQLVHLDLVTVEELLYKKCIKRYNYQCKFMAAQVDYRQLPVLMETMARFRQELGLHGTETGIEDF